MDRVKDDRSLVAFGGKVVKRQAEVSTTNKSSNPTKQQTTNLFPSTAKNSNERKEWNEF
jgi:hypothetical protein